MLNSQRGIAAIIAILMVGMMTLLGIAAITTSNNEVSIAGNELNTTRAFYAAEAGLEVASAKIQASFDSTGGAPGTLPAGSMVLNGATANYTTTDLGAAVQKVLTNGPLAGLNALGKQYQITAVGTSSTDQASSQVVQVFEVDLVPLFQFGVFYDDDMAAGPAFNMVVPGRVHCNGDMWLGAQTSLKFNLPVTAFGGIHHGTKYAGWDYTGAPGDVQFKNAAGTYVGMKNGASWVDCSVSDWYTQASSKWNGLVRDHAFGQDKLNLASIAGGNPHKLVERSASSTSSYEAKATLKFIDDKAYQKVASAWVDVTAAMTTAGVFVRAANKFQDSRESKQVDVTDLDVSQLYAKGYAPSNGILYFSDKTAGLDYPALRLKNVSTLGAGLTIAAENPVYTVGNVNTTNKKPMSILTDAYTILSGAWDDTKSTLPKASRVASNTSLNVSFITGDKTWTTTNYQGGLENLPRFMESWGSSKTCTIRGSMVNMWNSVQSTGDFTMNYYDPPTRDYGFDTDLNDPTKLPPGTPMILTYGRSSWQEQFVTP